MVDYVAIKAADPGGTINEAYDAMSAETRAVSRGRYKVTQLMIAEETTIELADNFRNGLKAAVDAGQLPDWAMNALDTEGIDVNNSQVRAKLQQIVDAGALEQGDCDAVLAMGDEDVPVWPGLKHGHIQNARQTVFGRDS